MPLESSACLDWMPPEASGPMTPRDDERLHEPVGCDNESLREPVLETPRLPACQSKHAIRTVISADELNKQLNQQTDDLMNHMKVLMLQQEQVIVQLLEARAFPAISNGVSGISSNGLVSPIPQDSGSKKRASWADCDSEIVVDEEELLAEPNTTRTSSCAAVSFLRKAEKPTIGEPARKASVTERFIKAHWHGSRPRGLPLSKSVISTTRRHREILRVVLSQSYFTVLMSLIIMLNTVLIIMETDMNAKCYTESNGCAPDWIWYVNIGLLVIYTLECMAVIDVYRWKVFHDKAQVFDIFLVGSGYLDLMIGIWGNDFPSMHALRLIRLTRLLRSLRLFSFVPELKAMIAGFMSSMRAMVSGFILLMLILIATAIAAVQLMQPASKKVQQTEYCLAAFDSVWNATILFFQVIGAGDSWGQCLIPIIQAEPVSLLFFSASLVAVQLGFLNLVMSVIIDGVTDSRQKDTAARLKEQEFRIRASRAKWTELFEKLDEDGSGELSVEEIIKGFDTLQDFSADLKLLGIQREDLPQLLLMMDQDGNGTVDIHELVTMFDMVWHFDNQMHQVSMGMQLRVIAQHLDDHLNQVENGLKSFFMKHGRPPSSRQIILANKKADESAGA